MEEEEGEGAAEAQGDQGKGGRRSVPVARSVVKRVRGKIKRKTGSAGAVDS